MSKFDDLYRKIILEATYTPDLDKLAKKEVEVLQKAKDFFDEGSFVKTIGEFKGEDDVYGLWISGEGLTTKDGISVVDYYDPERFDGTEEFKQFLKDNDMNFEWYDSGTGLCYLFDREAEDNYWREWKEEQEKIDRGELKPEDLMPVEKCDDITGVSKMLKECGEND